MSHSKGLCPNPAIFQSHYICNCLSAPADFTKFRLKAGPFTNMSGHFSTAPNSPKIYWAPRLTERPHALPNLDFPQFPRIYWVTVSKDWGPHASGSGTHVFIFASWHLSFVVCHLPSICQCDHPSSHLFRLIIKDLHCLTSWSVIQKHKCYNWPIVLTLYLVKE